VLALQVGGVRVAPPGAPARNPAFDITPQRPAFDITPQRLITAIITENGVVYPPFDENLAKAVAGDVP